MCTYEYNCWQLCLLILALDITYMLVMNLRRASALTIFWSSGLLHVALIASLVASWFWYHCLLSELLTDVVMWCAPMDLYLKTSVLVLRFCGLHIQYKYRPTRLFNCIIYCLCWYIIERVVYMLYIYIYMHMLEL